MTLDEQFNNLAEKLQLVQKAQNRLRRENVQLRTQLEAQIKESEKKENKISELTQQVSILKLAAGDMNEKDKKAFEREINRYIKEIDKCIAYLGK